MVITYKGLELDIPYEAYEVEDVKIIMPLNDHGHLYVKLLIPEGKISEYINKSDDNEKVIVSKANENGTKTKVFVGKIYNVHMIFESGLHVMEITCNSFTKEFDIKKNSRTFCDLDMSYADVINTVLSSYAKSNFTDNLTNDSLIGDFILQYEETDWQFIKRLATHFNGLLISESTEDYGRFHFGIPNIDNKVELDIKDYEIVKDIDDFRKKDAIGISDNFSVEYTKWDIISRRNLNLGEKVIFNNVSCIVTKILIEVYKDEIRTIYTLGVDRGIRTAYATNTKIFGMSLPASVKNVQGNMMNVHFEIDKKDESYSNEKYFTYAIESSSWYCMPETGSKVHIYFPSNDEHDAIAVHAVRSTDAGGKYASKTQNPDNKSFSHTSGSEMSLTPSDMNFNSDAGGASSINLSQSGDVTVSGTNINITASEDIEIGAGELKPQSIQISAGEKVDISKGGTSGVQLTDQAFLQSPMIKYDGKIKDAVPLPDEIAHRNDEDAKTIEDINSQAKAYEKQKIDEAKSKMGFGALAMVVGAVAIGVAVTVSTGGIGVGAGIAIAAGAVAMVGGASKIQEGACDYKKTVESGDFSQSFNFLRDTVFRGNQDLYDLVTYGAVLIAGASIALLTGGAAVEVLKDVGMNMASDTAFNMLADYADDGHINNGFMSYFESACVSGATAGTNVGVMNKIKKSERAAELIGDVDRCKKLGRIRIASDVGLDLLGQYATTGDANIAYTVLKKTAINKMCFSDPVDGATGSLYIPATDITLPDVNEEFKIERKYESVNPRVGALGKNWTTNFEMFIDKNENQANVLCSDGHIETFIYINNEWINDKGNSKRYVLEELKDNLILKANEEKKTYYYDLNGRLEKVTDRLNNEMRLTYVENQIDTLTTFSNYKLFFKYKDNKVIEIKDELGRTVQYKYNGDYLTEVVHVDRGITRYTSDEDGFIDSITDQNGQTYTKNSFDKRGRVTKQEFPNGDNCIVTYDDSAKEVTFYYTQSKRTEKTRFNNEGLITHLFYEDGTTEEFKYDKYQNKIYEKDRNGNITRREFNEYGNLLKEIKPNNLITEYEYDENHNLLKETDNTGKEILNTYDNSQNLIEKKTKISVGRWKTERFTYDRFGRILSKTDSNNNTIKYDYETDDKLFKDPISVTTASGYKYNYTYDKVGRNTEITTEYGIIEFGYNNLNYVSEIKDANGNITKKYYDKMGNLISLYTPNAIIDGKQDGEGYHYQYDNMDRLISIKNPLGNIQKSIRDSEGNIIKEINPNYFSYENEDSAGIKYVYDKDNRKIKTIYPDCGVERFFYDSNGNVIKHVSPEYYDETKDDGLGYSYTYDENNNLKSIINEEGNVEKTFEYDLHGNVIKETDNEGNSTLYKYDLLSNVIEKKVPVEKVINENTKNEEIKYSVVYYEYDNNGNKILEKHGLDLILEDEECFRCNEIKFSYDSENRLIEVSDKYGAKTKYKYDCLNHKTYESFRINEDTSKVIHYEYDDVGNLVEKKEEINGRFISSTMQGKNVWAKTKYEYDRNGNVTKIVTPKGYETSRIYDELDRVVEEFEEDKNNEIYRSRVYKFDKSDNIISISEYSGEDAKTINNKYSNDYNYDIYSFDRYQKSKEYEKLLEDRNFKYDKKKKTYKYDEQNRLTHFINISGNTTRLFYDKNDRIIKQVLPEQYDETIDDGEGTTYLYNVKGQVVEVKNALGETVTKNTYDDTGNLKTSIDGENNKVEYTYTLLGQIKDITTPNSRKENKVSQSYSYDGRGNITGIVDGNGNETKYLLDDWGRIIQITTPEGGNEKYTYDYAGNITSTTDANGNTIQYFYNSLGLVSEIKDQEGDSEYFYYDEEGNLIKHIDRNNNNIDRSYNMDKNIVTLEAYKLEETNQGKQNTNLLSRHTKEIKKEKNKLNVVRQNFKYNSDGTLSNANFNNMYYNYEYNAEGLLERKTASGKTLLSYTYDKNKNIKTLQDITNKSSTYTYDKANRLKTIQDENNKIQAQYEYYSNDNIKSITLGNGVKSDYTYDGDGNVSSLVTVTQNGEVLVDYSYAYDLNGNRLQKVSSKHKNYYSYDSMNRLVDSSYDGRSEIFTYDKVGNRLTKTTNDITEKYVYNVKNQLKELHNKAGVTFFAYDKQGNTIKEETNSGNNLFEYNTLNQQVKAITKDNNTLISRYDSEGLRYEIEENEKLSKFIYNKKGNNYSPSFVGVSSIDQNKFWGVTYDEVLVETDSNDNVVSRFTRGYDVVSADVDNKKYYYSVDEQGSTEFITDVSGSVKNEYRYDAFGNILESKEDIHNRITYTGQQFDNVTQQYYLRARYYNPVIGRFTQEDVYRGDGLNLYDYCENNPVVYYDPSGYMNCDSKSRSNPATYYSYDELHKIIKDKGLSGKGIGFEAHHLLEKQFANMFNVDKGDIISVALTPRHHRGVGSLNEMIDGSNIDNLINKELRKRTGQKTNKLAKKAATREDIWRAHKKVYKSINQEDWAKAVYEKYVKSFGIKY